MDDLYDEFGNYIGEAEESEEESQHGANGADAYVYDEEAEEDTAANDQQLMELDEDGPSNAVVLHEDKQYYPTAQQVYGPDVETMVQEEDAQPLSQPIIAPIQQKKFTVQETDLPSTALMDMLVMQTHDIHDRLEKKTGRKRDEQLRYTDVHLLERERGISIKSAPMSLVLQGTRGKSHLLNILDTPGHVNFVDEVAASLRLVDGVVLVVDVVEGVQINTEQVIKYAVQEDLPLTLIVNKMDRLILELKLPPTDAYFKLKHVIEEVNTVIENAFPVKGRKGG
ncbi:MAG: u5 small nuclear ribonucleo component [Lasallia pustulata]|uniref:U5 small nuclear ribonucleo component n=1 Tax=Lasallia pustulata TaxID=136370 RepID=A0A5M8Q1P0_9LECA|nr:MAG: u5 small nuclear ribonucleo component [Lasallia pustulata]